MLEWLTWDLKFKGSVLGFYKFMAQVGAELKLWGESCQRLSETEVKVSRPSRVEASNLAHYPDP